MRGITGLRHFSLKVNDIGRSMDFYCDQLGLIEISRAMNNHGGIRSIYLQIADGQFFELISRQTATSTYQQTVREMDHICFSIINLDIEISKLIENGIIAGKSATFHDRNGNRSVKIHDPDGNEIELIEMRQSCAPDEAPKVSKTLSLPNGAIRRRVEKQMVCTKPVARMKDIAVKTGYSANTVSLALRDSSKLPESTKSTIREMASMLNYLPNHAARSLVRKETKTIGLILSDVNNPVLASLVQNIEIELLDRGYITLFATSNNDIHLEMQMIDAFFSRRVDGMLIFPCERKNQQHIKKLRKRNFPVVSFIDAHNTEIDAVCIDERSGAYKAVTHLLNNGHKNIALFDVSSKLGNADKRNGYCEALRDQNLPVEKALIFEPKDSSFAAGYSVMHDLCQANYNATAVFTSNDSLALGALRYCSETNLVVPRDLAIVGFDNIDISSFAETPLTTINYDVKSVTRLATKRLFELIDHQGNLPKARICKIDPNLIIRESSNYSF